MNLTQMTVISTMVGQESFGRNGVATMVNKRVQNAVHGCNFKHDRMTSVHFQGKPFNTRVIQVYTATSNAKEAEVERFYAHLQILQEQTPKKDVLSIFQGQICLLLQVFLDFLLLHSSPL